ncbi:hypothetical protein CCACVL1_28943 [Corchorus capsularis]|uniref:Uncharacterized protein n=1 Tax=Corchorus capsularis TaxID=210143 RepID=A0A1R3G4M3_COCAP|nr:hypothetical protein CCACVL1_28943 [Corchorus capsularis]
MGNPMIYVTQMNVSLHSAAAVAAELHAESSPIHSTRIYGPPIRFTECI